jgi:hypothetical protein
VSGAVAVNSWPGSTMFPRLTVLSFVRPATAHPLTIRAGSCSPLPRLLRSLANEQVVVVDGPHPRVQLATIAATLERWVLVGRALRCPSIGLWRSLTVNNGRQHTALTCTIGVGSGQDDGTGRAFQARDLVGPHRSHELPDRSGQHRSYRSASPQLTGRTPPGAANPRRRQLRCR